MNKLIILYVILIQIACSSINADNKCYCFETITNTKITPRDEFVNCIKLLSNDSINSEKTYSKLSRYWKVNLSSIIEPLDMYSMLPLNHKNYDFDNEPKKIHRLRAIKEILRYQLKSGRISDNKLIESFEQNTNQKFYSFVLSYNYDYSEKLQEYLYQISIKDNRLISNYSTIQNQIFNLLIRLNPNKYLEEIFIYFLVNESNEIDVKVMKFIGTKNIDIISDEMKDRIITELSQKVFRKPLDDAFLDNVLLALDRLLSNSENLSERFNFMRELLLADHKIAYEKIKSEVEKRN